MDHALEPTPAPYDGLHVRSADIFPKTCTRCDRRYGNINEFVQQTTPVFRSSGLMEHQDPTAGTVVLLIRNCTCGTSLALHCKDRRAKSEQGLARREHFATLVALLVEVGMTEDRAQSEVRRLLHHTET